MAEYEQYDAIVSGAGQAGVPLARDLAGAGWNTALIECEHVGGTCVNEGCTPTKTMIASARVAYLARRAADYGIDAGPVRVDMSRVRQRKRAIVESFRSAGERRIENTPGLDYVQGAAQFTGDKMISVRLVGGGTRHLRADRIFINTGGRAHRPPLAGVERVDALDSTSIMELDTVPEHLLIIGGGYIASEFGQMFRRFGSAVTILQRRDQLLPLEDADVAQEVARVLTEDGIDVKLEAQAQCVDLLPDGRVRLEMGTPAGTETVTGSHVMMAAGRVPNTDDLNLQATGIEPDYQGYIPVNNRLETDVPGIYALGDVKGGPAFTHISYDDYRVIRTNLLEGGDASIADRLLMYVVFIDPQLGRVGLSERAARASGRAIRVAKMPMSWVARAREVDEPRGLIKAVVDAETDQILGAAVLGIEGGEIMAVLQMAMMGGLPYTRLRDGVFAHPTLAESLNTLFAAFEE